MNRDTDSQRLATKFPDRTDAIKLIADRFFGTIATDVTCESDREDILGDALEAYYRQPYEGRTDRLIEINHYLERLMVFSHKRWRSLQRVRREFGLVESLVDDGQKVVQSAFDPLVCLGDLAGSQDCQDPQDWRVKSPPFRVVFPSSVQYTYYRDNPYHVPMFTIVPNEDKVGAGNLGYRRTERTWRRASSDDLAVFQSDLLEKHQSAFEECLQRFVPQYIRDSGWRTLPKNLKWMLHDVNCEGLTISEVTRKRNLRKNEFRRLEANLNKLGWNWFYSLKRDRRILVYNPVYHGKHYASILQARIAVEGLPNSLLLSRMHLKREAFLRSDEEVSSALTKEANRAVTELIDLHVDYTALVDYHERICSLIKSIVERPSFARKMTLDEINHFLGELPEQRQKSLIFAAISKRKSIVDVMGLSDHFPDLLLFSPGDDRVTISALEDYFDKEYFRDIDDHVKVA